MEYVWMWVVVSGVLAIVSVVLLSGHGAGLLAGYSTASAAERAHVNAPKLARIMGTAVLVCAIYAAAVALLVYAHVQGAVDRTTLFFAGGIGALVPIAALCVAGYRANMGRTFRLHACGSPALCISRGKPRNSCGIALRPRPASYHILGTKGCDTACKKQEILWGPSVVMAS